MCKDHDVFFYPAARYCSGNCLAQVGNSFSVRGNSYGRAMDEEWKQLVGLRNSRLNCENSCLGSGVEAASGFRKKYLLWKLLDG